MDRYIHNLITKLNIGAFKQADMLSYKLALEDWDSWPLQLNLTKGCAIELVLQLKIGHICLLPTS